MQVCFLLLLLYDPLQVKQGGLAHSRQFVQGYIILESVALIVIINQSSNGPKSNFGINSSIYCFSKIHTLLIHIFRISRNKMLAKRKQKMESSKVHCPHPDQRKLSKH